MMPPELLQALWRGEKQTLALVERCDLSNPAVKKVRDLKAAAVASLEEKLKHGKQSKTTG